MNRGQAQRMVQRVINNLADTQACIEKLWDNRAWELLGYDSWANMCATEFAVLRELSQVDQRKMLTGMTDQGLSTRAQAAVLGVSQPTIRDWQVKENLSPATVTGIDGKTYSKPAPKPKSKLVPLQQVRWFVLETRVVAGDPAEEDIYEALRAVAEEHKRVSTPGGAITILIKERKADNHGL